MKIFFRIAFLLAIVFCSLNSFGQEVTRIKGHVYDANTNEGLPFVNIIFVGTSIGTTTDVEGRFEMETNTATTQLQASFLGYETLVKQVAIGDRQTIDFRLSQENLNLGEVVISTERVRYRNKDNPAVGLIREVIANKNQLSKENQDFYQYDKYEKIQVDINNVTEKFKSKKAFNQFQFIFDYVDTSSLNGKVYLPIFLRETSSKVFYRKNPGKTLKEHQLGNKIVGFEGYVDNNGISWLLDKLYQEIDIYDNNINLLGLQFLSPLHALAPTFYKYFILDTMMVGDRETIKLAYTPRNDQDLAFSGHMWVTNDPERAVKKIELTILDNVNVNFIKDLKAVQEFEFKEDGWLLTKDQITIDFDVSVSQNGIGLFGTRTVSYKDYVLNQEAEPKWYKGTDQIIVDENFMNRDDSFWESARHEDLSQSEQNIYTMTDSIENVPAFKRAADIAILLLAGYIDVGPISVGPVNTFYSFNDIEGFRGRFGFQTNQNFSKRFRFDTYGAYGFKDKKWKYYGGVTYSFANGGFNVYPFHEITAYVQKDTRFPGQALQFIQEDNVLLSFKRGIADMMYYDDKYHIEYFREHRSRFSYKFSATHNAIRPGGTMRFVQDLDQRARPQEEDPSVVVSEVAAEFRFAPNEQFYQGMLYRIPIFNQYPVFELKLTAGLKNVLGSGFDYQKIDANVFKRFLIAPIGFTDVTLSAGKIFGDVPFPLLTMHRANQTYSYQLLSLNLMNFLEFASEEYVSVNVAHYFNGFVFNKVPLFKRLKWREVVTFKAIYGGVSDSNLESNEELLLWPSRLNEDGVLTTITNSLERKPYVEASVGIMNIFKLFRVDLVKRFTYLENPDAAEFGIRGRFKLEF